MQAVLLMVVLRTQNSTPNGCQMPFLTALLSLGFAELVYFRFAELK
jgi:hypothetical protein